MQARKTVQEIHIFFIVCIRIQTSHVGNRKKVIRQTVALNAIQEKSKDADDKRYILVEINRFDCSLIQRQELKSATRKLP